MCLHFKFSYPDSIRTRARRFLRCILSQVCFELLTRTIPITAQLEVCEYHWRTIGDRPKRCAVLARASLALQSRAVAGPGDSDARLVRVVA
jgi:hypothetical protein